MKVAVIGSRGILIDDLGKYLPKETTEILSGGASGVDSCAENYARKHHIPFTVFLPAYEKFGRCAPLKRNLEIIKNADLVLAFWNGSSHGTKHVIDNCRKMGTPVQIHILPAL